MPPLNPHDFPGYEEAVERERRNRDGAFLEMTETVSGFELLPLTIERWLMLRFAKNALLYGDVPTPEQLGQFLWVCSPKFNAKGKGRAWFLFCCSMAFRNLRRVQEIVIAARAYIEDTFQDRPRGSSTDGHQIVYFSDPAFLCYAVASRTGWGEDHILRKMPLKRVFEYMRVAQWSETDTPLHNPSNEVLHRCLNPEGTTS